MAARNEWQRVMAAAIYGAVNASAVGACGSPATNTAHEVILHERPDRPDRTPTGVPPPVSALDLPMAAGAQLVAVVDRLPEGRSDVVFRAGCTGCSLSEEVLSTIDRRAVVIIYAGGRHRILDEAAFRDRGIRTAAEAAFVAWFWQARHRDELELWSSELNAREIEGGFEVMGHAPGVVWCGDPQDLVYLHVTPQGDVRETHRVPSRSETHCWMDGRPPEDFVDRPLGLTVASYVRRTLHHEAESVPAFLRLAAELEAHGGPAALIRDAHRAANDERRHAHLWADVLERWGEPSPPRFRAMTQPVRPLLEVALENAVAGCLHELYAVARAAYQSQHASDALLRRAFARIVDDELRHAELAYRVDRWLSNQLEPAARRVVESTRAREAQAFHRALARPLPLVARLAGGPPPQAAQLLLSACLTAAAA